MTTRLGCAETAGAEELEVEALFGGTGAVEEGEGAGGCDGCAGEVGGSLDDGVSV